jgi:hypothetical protein
MISTFEMAQRTLRSAFEKTILMPSLNDTKTVGVTFVVFATITTMIIIILVLCRSLRQSKWKKSEEAQ